MVFVLTGSSPRKLRRRPRNLLAGRAISHQFFTFTASELGPDFSIEKAHQHGMLPTIHDPEKDVDPGEYLATYVQTYLREEIVAEGLTRQAEPFARFLEAASFSQGQPLNVSAVAREAGVHRKVVESYFQILQDLLIGVRVPVFQKRAKRRLSGHDLRGLRSFMEDYPVAKAFVLYGGENPAYFDRITALPITDALRSLPELL